MVLRNRASPSKQPDTREKKPKVEEKKHTWHSALAMLRTAPNGNHPAKIDWKCDLSTAPGAQVYKDYDCTLNQTSIKNHINKFCILQLIEYRGSYGVWHCSGRVGSDGQCKTIKWSSEKDAKKDFEKKFQEFTKNDWAARENFVFQTGKYTPVKVERGVYLTWSKDGDCPEALKNLPLGKLSKQQLVKGFEALNELEEALWEESPQDTDLEKLSSRYYNIVPRYIKRSQSPIINSLDLLHDEKDMLLELANIELAQSLRSPKIKEE